MEQEIMVSVNCLVYNHAKYLRKCLDGFVMQKTNFKFEVLIHDDASTDGSQDIIREYEEKYPDIIKPIYQTENQYSKHIPISKIYQYPRVKGKYIAFCEGDDYWCDKNKLQKQFEILEHDENLSICVHKVQSINEDGSLIENDTHPSIHLPNYLNSCDLISLLMSNNSYQFQTSSYMVRSEIMKEMASNTPKFVSLAKVGDYTIMEYCATKGSLYFIDDIMSCYRKGAIGSWTSEFSNNKELQISVILGSVESLKSFNEYTDYEYDEMINYKICSEEFKYFRVSNDYKSCMNKKYKKIRKSLNKKEYFYILLNAYFKNIFIFLKRIKNGK